MVNMGCRDTNGLKELGHKVEIVFGNSEKVLIPSNLVYSPLVSDDVMEGAKTNLL
jgi:hypothetical protein